MSNSHKAVANIFGLITPRLVRGETYWIDYNDELIYLIDATAYERDPAYMRPTQFTIKDYEKEFSRFSLVDLKNILCLLKPFFIGNPKNDIKHLKLGDHSQYVESSDVILEYVNFAIEYIEKEIEKESQSNNSNKLDYATILKQYNELQHKYDILKENKELQNKYDELKYLYDGLCGVNNHCHINVSNKYYGY